MKYFNLIFLLVLSGCGIFNRSEKSALANLEHPTEADYAAPADLHSPFPPTVLGVTIPNLHLLDEKKGKIYRGERPGDRVQELKNLKINEVLIFKSSESGDVASEKKTLRAHGFSAAQVHEISFPWRKFPSLKEACRQTLIGLQIMSRAIATKKRNLYIHCTVGEDRTGYLSGLYRVLVSNWTPEKAFSEEMCKRGYSAGNPKKPQFVIDAIDAELTPLFVHMSHLIESGRIHQGNLRDLSICEVPVDLHKDLATWHCPRISSLMY